MIVINARFLTQNITGVQRFANELCKRLPNTIKNHTLLFVAPKNISLKIKCFSNVHTFGRFHGQLWEQIDLPIFLKSKDNPLLINLVGIGPVFYKRKILAIYDLAFKHFPEWFSYSFQRAYNVLVPLSAKNSLFLITDSNYVKEDIYRTYKFNKKKITVIYAASSDIFLYKGLKREKIILTVSSIDPRKNLGRIIEAYNLLDTDYKLVIVGSKNKTFSKLDIDKKLLNENVIFTGYLADNELVELYNKAEIFIYASLFEGFGIPPLEAQSCGCACIVSNSTALPEVYLDSVEYCDPFDVNSIRSSINSLITDKPKRNSFQEKGLQNVERFDWRKSAKVLEKVIENSLDEKSIST